MQLISNEIIYMRRPYLLFVLPFVACLFSPRLGEAQMSDLSEVFIDLDSESISGVAEEDTLARTNTVLSATIIGEAMKYIGTPYRWGGKTPAGFDCAGFVRYVYSKFGLTLSPSAPSQVREGTRLKNDEIQPGDLVFYGGSRNRKSVGHVGLVTEVNSEGFKFVHASNTGVRVSSSNEPYYRSRYICACRVIDKILIGEL